LCSVFSDPEQNIDHRLAATTALRRSEDVRLMPSIERLPVRPDAVDIAEPQDLAELVARRKARAEGFMREAQEAMAREREAAEARSRERSALKARRNGNSYGGNGSASGLE
jgi:hypothetical protein